jgi:hypothetical protein
MTDGTDVLVTDSIVLLTVARHIFRLRDHFTVEQPWFEPDGLHQLSPLLAMTGSGGTKQVESSDMCCFMTQNFPEERLLAWVLQSYM